MRADAGEGLLAQHLDRGAALDPGGVGAEEHGADLLVGKRVAVGAIDMGDVGRYHLGHMAGARLGLGEDALRFLQRRVRRGQRPVRGGEVLGVGEQLLRQLRRPSAQQRLGPLDVGDVGINRHPAALRERRPLDREGAPVRPLPLDIVRLEPPRLVDALPDGRLGVGLRPVFAARDEEGDRVLEARARLDQPLGQVEHLLVAAVRHRQPQVGVEDRDRLRDQVQPRPGQFSVAVVLRHSIMPRDCRNNL